MKMSELSGRRILITGANRGIGKALAIASVHAGATVFAHARKRDNLDELVDQYGVTPLIAELSDANAAARSASSWPGQRSMCWCTMPVMNVSNHSASWQWMSSNNCCGWTWCCRSN